MVLLAVDPATTSGWALYRDGKLARYGWIETRTPECVGRIDRLILGIDAAGGPERPDRALVVEEHTWDRGKASTRRLHEARTAWETVAVLRGWTAVRVNAATWQAALLAAGSSAARKAKAMQTAACLCRDAGLPPDDLTEDSADAVCLGYFHVSRECVATAAVRAQGRLHG